MNYKIIFSYDGSKYFGYAVQKNEEHTIEAVVEKAISTILNKETKIYASGRTDRGVHALNQVATFKSENELNLDKFLRSLNKLVPNDIYFKSIKKVSDNFNARFNAKSKVYLYIINVGEYDPFMRAYETVEQSLNYDLLKKSSEIFVGEHDFKNFTSKPTDDNNFIRNIYSISFKKKKDRVYIEFKGDGFMTYMVRKILGGMIEVSKGNMSLDDLSALLNKKDRDIITYTAPSKGLYLKKVNY
jgi:tRNA pseudouridine38-40 synthase